MTFYPRRMYIALLYFPVAVVAVTVLESYPFYGWASNHQVVAFRIAQTLNYSITLLVHVVAVLLALRWLGYRLQRKTRPHIASGEA
jgi:hypothetical protein